VWPRHGLRVQGSSGEMERADRSEGERWLQEAGIRPGQRVLDIGFRDPGELRLIAELVGPSGSVLGLELDPACVRRAVRELSELGISNIAVKEGSILAIPTEDRSFELVLCKGVLHEVRPLEWAFAELARVCKPGGLLIVMDFQRFSGFKFALYRAGVRLRGRRCPDVHPGFSREQLTGLLRDHGWEPITWRPLPEQGRMGFVRTGIFMLKALRLGPG